jgi:hypothetical protein
VREVTTELASELAAAIVFMRLLLDVSKPRSWPHCTLSLQTRVMMQPLNRGETPGYLSRYGTPVLGLMSTGASGNVSFRTVAAAREDELVRAMVLPLATATRVAPAAIEPAFCKVRNAEARKEAAEVVDGLWEREGSCDSCWELAGLSSCWEFEGWKVLRL